jgi:hypothetical protein
MLVTWRPVRMSVTIICNLQQRRGSLEFIQRARLGESIDVGNLADGASEGTTHPTGTIGRRRGDRREPWMAEKNLHPAQGLTLSSTRKTTAV